MTEIPTSSDGKATSRSSTEEGRWLIMLMQMFVSKITFT